MFIVRNAFVSNEKKENTFSKLDNLQMYRTTRTAQQLHETEKKNIHNSIQKHVCMFLLFSWHSMFRMLNDVAISGWLLSIRLLTISELNLWLLVKARNAISIQISEVQFKSIENE